MKRPATPVRRLVQPQGEQQPHHAEREPAGVAEQVVVAADVEFLPAEAVHQFVHVTRPDRPRR
ncbi:MAG: hypothetical protein WDM96_09740 [Lacunisphaera sp.]